MVDRAARQEEIAGLRSRLPGQRDEWYAVARRDRLGEGFGLLFEAEDGARVALGDDEEFEVRRDGG